LAIKATPAVDAKNFYFILFFG